MSQKKRKYQINYLDFGFTYLIEDDLQIPQCVVCMKTFSNSTMKPASLKQHLANAHPSMISKNRSFFESKLSRLKRQKLDQTGMFWRTNKAAVHASNAIALHSITFFTFHYMPFHYKLKSHITLVKPF